MNHEVRLLPHLNSYYLQKKAYDHHRKKMETIKNSMLLSKQKSSSIFNLQKQKNNSNMDLLNDKRYEIKTIRQQTAQKLSKRTSPWAKRIKQQRAKQNERLSNRIKNCLSSINRKELQLNHLKFQKIKERLQKYISLPSSQKTLLKCKYSLELINTKERKIEDHLMSRINSRRLSRVTEMKPRQQLTMSEERINFSEMKKKNSFDLSFAKRNHRKLLSQFNNKEINHMSIQSNKQKSRQIKRPIKYRTESSNNSRYKKEQTTFPTQIQL